MPTDTAPSRRRVVEWSDPTLVAKAAQGLDGLALLRAMMAGEVSSPPLIALPGIDLVSADPGRVTMRMEPGAYLYTPRGSEYGGARAPLPDSVMGCAVHSALPLGRGCTTLEIEVDHLRAVTAASGPLTTVGEIVHVGHRQAMAEARLTDGTGRLCAMAGTTCLLDPPIRGDTPPPAMAPVLAAWTRIS